MRKALLALALLVVLAAGGFLFACSRGGPLPQSAGYGPEPQLPAPQPTWLPIVKIAPAKGWAEGAMPQAAPGFTVTALARGLDHPRWLYVLPNGDVLVAESNRPPKADPSLRDRIMGVVQGWAGAGGESADRISLLRDADGDGTAELRTVFLEGLHSPFGMALVGSDLYVANTDAVLRFAYVEGATRIEGQGSRVVELPAGPINHHWTKNILASPDGSRLYATSGSNSNVAENGTEAEADRAAILEIDLATSQRRLFASGLRNPNGLDWQPDSGALWTAVNERDEIGDDLVPDYMTSVRDGGFYGWPYSYFGRHVDPRPQPQRLDLVAAAIVPDYALGAHTASLGLAFYDGTAWPERYRGGAIIGQHGSWNRSDRAGYKVVFVPFDDAGRPAGPPEDLLTGFLSPNGDALGRPVGVAVDSRGAVLVADDVGNIVWRIAAAP